VSGNEEDARPYPAEASVGSPEDTAVLNLAEGDRSYQQFGTPWAGEADKAPRPSFDAPAEDGGVGGSWRYEGQPLQPVSASVGAAYGSAHWSPAASAAWALRHNDTVASGPWPVRQYAWGPGELQLGAMDMVDALASLGERFILEVWWPSHTSAMARVSWGVALDWTGEELASMVESWPEL
jgi:hypothetical protein